MRRALIVLLFIAAVLILVSFPPGDARMTWSEDGTPAPQEQP